ASLSLSSFTDTATTQISTLSLHDALPIYARSLPPRSPRAARIDVADRRTRPRRSPAAARDDCAPSGRVRTARPSAPAPSRARARSEEHTSELQSRENLVCRLLLEKKKKKT